MGFRVPISPAVVQAQVAGLATVGLASPPGLEQWQIGDPFEYDPFDTPRPLTHGLVLGPYDTGGWLSTDVSWDADIDAKMTLRWGPEPDADRAGYALSWHGGISALQETVLNRARYMWAEFQTLGGVASEQRLVLLPSNHPPGPFVGGDNSPLGFVNVLIPAGATAVADLMPFCGEIQVTSTNLANPTLVTVTDRNYQSTQASTLVSWLFGGASGDLSVRGYGSRRIMRLSVQNLSAVSTVMNAYVHPRHY